MDFAVPEHRFSVPGMREEQLHTVTSGTTPFNKLLSLFSDGSTSQAPWSALERKGSGTSTSAAPTPALTAAQKQELAAANGRSQKIKRGQKRSSPSEDGTGACDDGAAEEEELDMSKLTPEEREQLANADVKEAKRLRRLLRNRCSAQLARERRKVYISELEAKVAAHEQRIEELEGKLATTEQQNAVLRRIIRTMRPPEGAEPVALPPVDAVRLRETAAAAAAANAAANVGAAAADAAPGNAQPGLGSQQGSPQLVQQMDVDQQQRQGRQNVPTAQQAMPQQVVPQMSMAPPAAIMAARSMRTSTPEPPTPQLPAARQQQQEPLCQYHMQAQQQLSQQQQQQQQQGVVPALPPLPPAPRPAHISMQQRVEHSMELGPFSVAYRASLEAQKLHQQKEQAEQQQQQQQQRSRYHGPPPQQLQQQPQRHEQEQYVQYDCDTSALFGRGSLPVPIVPKSQLQQLLMQQQLQQEEEQRQQQQDQRMYAQSFSQGGNRMDVHSPHCEAQSHGNNSSSLHVVPTSSWRSHSRPSHSNPMPQQRMQQAKQYESYSFPGQYDADAVAQKYSDALGVVPKRHRSSHGSSRRARDVVHVVPDVGAMSFPPDELLAALLSA